MGGKWHVFLLPVLFIGICYGYSVDYNLFNTIEEVVDFETSCILKASSAEELSDAYASRGESLLLCGNLEQALEDFHNAYDFGTAIQDRDEARSCIFRALFGQALTYGNLDRVDRVIPITDQLKEIMQETRCSDCQPNAPIQHITLCTHTLFPIVRCGGDVPIYGPDEISTRDCIDFVNNTLALAKLLICKSPASVRGILTLTMDQLGEQARYCCRAGKSWKGCVQKLCNKYHMWNQKWKAFGIPPDPAWD